MNVSRRRVRSLAFAGLCSTNILLLAGCDLGFFSTSKKSTPQNTSVQQSAGGGGTPSSVFAPDPSFGDQGKVVTALSPQWDRIRGLGLQADGHIVAGGSSYGDTSVNKNRLFAMARYDAQGGLDRTFGNANGALGTGLVTTGIGTADAEGTALLVLSDSSLLLSGSARNGTNSDFALMHYASNGVPDSSGPVLLDFGLKKDDLVNAAALDSQGHAVLAGSTYDATGHQVFALARFNTQPVVTLDKTFGNNGLVTTSFRLGKNQSVQGVAIQPDGKIVAVGYVNTGSNTDFAIARYLSNGRLDGGFGNAGLAVTDFGSSLDDAATAVAVQPDLKILVAGYANNGSNIDFALARYDSAGRPDLGFGANGRTMTDFSADAYAKSLVLSPTNGGAILVSGYALSGNNYQFAVARYSASGQLDSTFGNSGKIITGFGINQNSYSYASVFLPDGGFLLGGESYSGRSQFDFALLKLK